MSGFAARVAALIGAEPDRLERLAGGDLSEVLLGARPDGRRIVAKGGTAIAAEAAMLRTLAGLGLPAPVVDGEHDGILLLEHIENDGVFSPAAWRSIGAALRSLHDSGGERYGWSVDHALGTVALDNRETSDWPAFWGEQRLLATATILDRPWRARVEALVRRLGDLLPSAPPPALLHGDLWTGNLLVQGGALRAFIDPACYHGHAEVDLSMLTLFDTPPDDFWSAYGSLDAGWGARRPIYQLFPALVHLRLFGTSYAGMADRLLTASGA